MGMVMQRGESQGREVHEFIDVETGEIVLIALTPEEFSLYLKTLVSETVFDWESDEEAEG
jgi:hypothetical protein